MSGMHELKLQIPKGKGLKPKTLHWEGSMDIFWNITCSLT